MSFKQGSQIDPGADALAIDGNLKLQRPQHISALNAFGRINIVGNAFCSHQESGNVI